MADLFRGNCLPALIGSLPLTNHAEAAQLVLNYTPQIPVWVQLPAFKEEGMIAQFLPGLPGLVTQDDRVFIDVSGENFDNDLVSFYEDYMAVTEEATDLSSSRFVLKKDTAEGFFVLIEHKSIFSAPLKAVKGQVTGPITFTTGLSDQNRRAIFYDEQLRDVAVKHLALKARWQVRELSQFGCPVIIFIDEPALAGFGSSEFISIAREDIATCLNEVIESIHIEGGLAGVHVCANTDWSMLLESSVDIVNFDAYAYFDKFILYPDQIVRFFESGRTLAWGIVPTLHAEDIEKETTESLITAWEKRCEQVQALGIDRSSIMTQSLITPSCGCGSLSKDLAVKVLELTKEISENLRSRIS